jgi:hypothetical protein
MHIVKSYDEAKKFFLRACKTHDPGEIILFHDQRDTVNKLMLDIAEETGRTLIDKDLSTLERNELGCMKPGNCIAPAWLKDAMDGKSAGGYIVYLREFHLTNNNIQDDVMNILIRKEVQGVKFPRNTLIVLGVRKEDEATEALTHTHIIKFYK